MGKQLYGGIDWTHFTFNAWWGCTMVSAACAFCYAKANAARWAYDVWGDAAARRFFGNAHWDQPLRWEAQARADGLRRLVFCGSMMDWAEERSDLDQQRARLWDLIAQTPHLWWLLLTKRPQNIPLMLPAGWGSGWNNVCLMTTVESQETLWRVRKLAEVPAVARGLSIEPMLDLPNLPMALDPGDDDWEMVNDLQDANDEHDPEQFIEECEEEGDWVNCGHGLVESSEWREHQAWRRLRAGLFALRRKIHWAIVGCESRGKRVGRIGDQGEDQWWDWARTLRAWCEPDIAFFMKQGPLDGQVSKDLPRFPATLHVREIPDRFGRIAPLPGVPLSLLVKGDACV
jgi:protein gp37